MGMISQVFYESFVLENLDDFKNNEYCVRRGFNASISVSHLADHIYYFCKKNDQEKVNSYNVIGEYL